LSFVTLHLGGDNNNWYVDKDSADRADGIR